MYMCMCISIWKYLLTKIYSKLNSLLSPRPNLNISFQNLLGNIKIQHLIYGWLLAVTSYIFMQSNFYHTTISIDFIQNITHYYTCISKKANYYFALANYRFVKTK
jgi:hypothetical protein